MNKRLLAVVGAIMTGLLLTGCTADPGTSSPSTSDPVTSSPSASGNSAVSPSPSGGSAVTTQTLDPSLRAELPASIRSAGTITSINTGSYPPFQTVAGDGSVTGASEDLQNAIGQLLGIEIKDQTAPSTAAVLIGMQAGRYALAFGPFGDYPVRQAQATFVDWALDHVVFAVQKGNPDNITDLTSTCGKNIAVLAGASAEQVINKQSQVCVSQGKQAVHVLSFQDTPTGILAVQAGRASALFTSQAVLGYFVGKSNGALELTGLGQPNGFGPNLDGAIVAKDSPLAPVLLKAIQKLQANGTYDAIMTKWGLAGVALKTPGINLSKTNP